MEFFFFLADYCSNVTAYAIRQFSIALLVYIKLVVEKQVTK